MFMVNIYLLNHLIDLSLFIRLFWLLLLSNHFLFLRLDLNFDRFLSLIFYDSIKINLLFLIFKRISALLSFNNINFSNFLLCFDTIVLNQLSNLFILYLILNFIWFIIISLRICQISMLSHLYFFGLIKLLIIFMMFNRDKISWRWNLFRMKLC